MSGEKRGDPALDPHGPHRAHARPQHTREGLGLNSSSRPGSRGGGRVVRTSELGMQPLGPGRMRA
jgi:hypothetical protein